jgi:hypothetical protein
LQPYHWPSLLPSLQPPPCKLEGSDDLGKSDFAVYLCDFWPLWFFTQRSLFAVDFSTAGRVAVGQLFYVAEVADRRPYKYLYSCILHRLNERIVITNMFCIGVN